MARRTRTRPDNGLEPCSRPIKAPERERELNRGCRLLDSGRDPAADEISFSFWNSKNRTGTSACDTVSHEKSFDLDNSSSLSSSSSMFIDICQILIFSTF